MKSKIYILIGVVVVVFGIWYLVFRDNDLPAQVGESGMENVEEIVVENPEPIPVEDNQFTKTYSSPNYGFSFNYPESYKSTVIDDFLPDGTSVPTIVVQESNTMQGFQIRISPFDEEINMTEERIKEDIPDLEIRDSQPLQVGPNRFGLAFMSDNPSYGNASREVWFVFRGNLYQISTYASLDTLLQQVLNTWQFN